MLKPMKNFIIAKKQKPAEKTASGLLLPDKNKTDSEYVVEAVGKEVEDIKKGDKVIFKEYSATNVKIGDTDYAIVKDEDILATL